MDRGDLLAVDAANFPAEVPFVPTLAMVPIQDDTPAGYKPKVATAPIRNGSLPAM